ncbi:HdeD family acid-resistance protein [Lysobacter sp. GCM10012299]|uniref:HdeD family acid-resistance protein n=1 Tax=Lysobacter sp. GCM10012299 TaxID=3317333 RepID=UPI0036214BE3
MSSTGLLASLGRSWWVLVVYGVIAVLFGISAFAWPGSTAIAIAWAFGVMALAEGVISLVALFRKDVTVSKAWLAVYAIASIAFGLMAVMHPLAVAGVLLLLLAVWLVIAGIWRIVLAIRVRKEIEGEWLIALSGVLAIALGVMFFVHPAAGLVTVALWIGVVALVYGVLQIIAGFRLRKLAKAF